MADLFRIYSIEELREIHYLSMFNRRKIEKKGHACGCFHCSEQYDSSEIKAWTDNKRTALCPYCGIDSVLFENTEYPLTTSLLNQMHSAWFVD